MKENKRKAVSESYAKGQFTTLGLVMILYLGVVIILNNVITDEFLSTLGLNFDRVDYTYLVVGIKYIIILLGSMIPFFILMKVFDIRLSEMFVIPHISMTDVISLTIIFICLTSFVIFILSYVNIVLPIEGEILYPIGLNKGEDYFNNYLYIFLFVIGTPIIEEFVFRGVIYKALSQYGTMFGMFTSSLLFSLMTQRAGEMILAFVLSIFLAYVTARYRSIHPAVFIHIIFNGFFLLVIWLVQSAYANIAVILFLVLFVLGMVIIVYRPIRFIRINRNPQSSYVFALFFSRISVIIFIILALIYPTIFIIYNSLL
ncbi:MAG: CPBP family intramembrane metalloprotease [Erysipelotrichaceae bacterium]|nr:CPBP family intramembrane metalloprotease [Erysipelotrichaceae bacterium]